MFLSRNASYSYRVGYIRRGKYGRQVKSVCLVEVDGMIGIQHFKSANHFVHVGESEFRHNLTDLFREEEEERNHVFRSARKLLSEHRILSCDTDRAGIQVANPHHDAAHCDERSAGKAELFGAEQSGNHNVSAGLQLTIGLHPNPTAQIVSYEH